MIVLTALSTGCSVFLCSFGQVSWDKDSTFLPGSCSSLSISGDMLLGFHSHCAPLVPKCYWVFPFYSWMLWLVIFYLQVPLKTSCYHLVVHVSFLFFFLPQLVSAESKCAKLGLLLEEVIVLWVTLLCLSNSSLALFHFMYMLSPFLCEHLFIWLLKQNIFCRISKVSVNF